MTVRERMHGPTRAEICRERHTQHTTEVGLERDAS